MKKISWKTILYGICNFLFNFSLETIKLIIGILCFFGIIGMQMISNRALLLVSNREELSQLMFYLVMGPSIILLFCNLLTEFGTRKNVGKANYRILILMDVIYIVVLTALLNNPNSFELYNFAMKYMIPYILVSLLLIYVLSRCVLSALETATERYSTSYKVMGTAVQVDTVIKDELKDISYTLSTNSLDEVEFINALLQMLEENPSLPIYCRVDGEIIDDNELCKIGRLKTYKAPQIDAYSVAFDDKIIIMSDGDYDIWFNDLFGDEPLPNIDSDNIYEYKKKRVDAAVDWQKVILLEIYTP